MDPPDQLGEVFYCRELFGTSCQALHPCVFPLDRVSDFPIEDLLQPDVGNDSWVAFKTRRDSLSQCRQVRADNCAVMQFPREHLPQSGVHISVNESSLVEW